MSYISKRKFKELAAVSSPHCISIYLPTIKGQPDSNRIILKNSLTEVKHKLEAFHLKEDQIALLTKQLEALFDDLDFWKKLLSGLALFSYDEQLDTIISEHSFNSEVFVASHLHLLGLVNLLDNRKDFYLFAFLIPALRSPDQPFNP